jgi:hypothetical protein
MPSVYAGPCNGELAVTVVAAHRHNLRQTPALAIARPRVMFFARVATRRGLPDATAPIVFEIRAAL